ncbi:PREDICTED: olee1-like protein [Populus euphratica]|uniref:Olee1-like protein n=1 Tax=Populus euphratica TaxID=75702 RepID=A0AAJ6T865_POPEU|nr:PREDICTED: olee1-like protein [Populus euphratica]
MAKSFTIAAFVLCFSSLLISAYAADYLNVEGKVYCDPCRVEFQTKISEGIPAAKVKLVCNNRDNGTETYTVEGATDSSGTYRLSVAGDHEDDICEIRLVESSRPDCNEPFRSIDSAKILLTKNAGVVDKTRYPNALGYMKKEAQPECANVLKEMGFLPLEV